MRHPLRRSSVTGGTDYTGSTLEDVQRHLGEWLEDTSAAIVKLEDLRKRVEIRNEIFDRVEAIKQYIRFFIDRFRRYAQDLDSALDGANTGVQDRHIRILNALFNDAEQQRLEAIRFKNKHIECDLRDERAREMLDAIYFETHSLTGGLLDIGNLAPRLSCFVGVPGKDQKMSKRDLYRCVVLDIIRVELNQGRKHYKEILAALDANEETFRDRWFIKTQHDFSRHGKMGKAGNLAEIDCWQDIAKNDAASARFQTWFLDQKKELSSR